MMNPSLLRQRGYSLRRILGTLTIGAAVVLAGCSDDDDDNNDAQQPEPEVMASYQVSIKNLTAGQPLSPIAVVLHESSWKSFATGEAASSELEQLAEGGDNTAYLDAAMASAAVFNSASGSGVLTPGSMEDINLDVSADSVGTLYLTLVSMLVNTNDALAALNAVDVKDMGVGEQLTFTALTYDSGTEANSESADTIPGPAAAGGAQEGYNASRDDVRDAIYVHAGVVTADDGLAGSVLLETHRWDNPAIQVVVERVQ